MSSKVKVITTGVSADYTELEEYNKKHLEIATALQKEIGDVSIVLDSNRIIEAVRDLSVYSQRTLIEPGLVSHKRKTQTKLNKLFAYLLYIRGKFDISIIILVGDYEWLDLRVKQMWDIVERFSHDDYERLGITC